jgi:hypothetical protein
LYKIEHFERLLFSSENQAKKNFSFKVRGFFFNNITGTSDNRTIFSVLEPKYFFDSRDSMRPITIRSFVFFGYVGQIPLKAPSNLI